jgi:preprotein translocase subunit YajC
VDGDDVVLEIAPGIEARFMKRAIMDVVSEGEAPDEETEDADETEETDEVDDFEETEDGEPEDEDEDGEEPDDVEDSAESANTNHDETAAK